jgi:hypothetical protein
MRSVSWSVIAKTFGGVVMLLTVCAVQFNSTFTLVLARFGLVTLVLS